jgi:glycosyltransferase involved in cell wall biosynthesis
MTQRLVSIHCMDPRGSKVGGMETHVRQLLRRHPADMRLLMVGIDDFGDLEIGKMHTIMVSGREIDFVPVMHIPASEQTTAAKSVSGSVTFRFAKAMAVHIPKIRRMIRGEAASAEVERFEFAPLARALGCPLVVMVHNEGDPKGDKMDSLLSRYWWINDTAEWLAFRLARRIFCVTPKLKERIELRHPSQAKKAEVLTVSVDTELFQATPFDLTDGRLKLVYAGRLDEFKDPALMFRVAKRLHEKLDGKFQFHFCGSADPHRFPEFRDIESYTVRHGALQPEGVAAVMRLVHMGILVSHWEGMPCFLLELLASGRPFGGLRLPQFDQVIEQGVNGRMVERAATPEQSVEEVSDAILAQWAEIRSGKTDPRAVHAKIVPWSVDNQLGRLFDALRSIARKGKAPVSQTVAAVAAQ